MPARSRKKRPCLRPCSRSSREDRSRDEEARGCRPHMEQRQRAGQNLSSGASGLRMSLRLSGNTFNGERESCRFLGCPVDVVAGRTFSSTADDLQQYVGNRKNPPVAIGLVYVDASVRLHVSHGSPVRRERARASPPQGFLFAGWRELASGCGLGKVQDRSKDVAAPQPAPLPREVVRIRLPELRA